MRFDLTPDDPQLGYKLLTATVTPRPIAWVSTLGADDVLNVAPYSFFNAMGHTPPVVAIGMMADPKKGLKDTPRNIRDKGEFVVNLVSAKMAEQMNETCAEAPYGVSEAELAGLRPAPSTHIAVPRIDGVPVAMECRVHQIVETGPQQMLVIGLVLAIHVDDEFVLNPDRAHIDTPALDLVARLQGPGWYAKSPQLFEMARPTYPPRKD